MSVQVILQPAAEADVQDAYEGRRAGLGRLFLNELQRTLENIGERPRSYPLIFKSARRVLLREFPYAVYYVPQAEHVDVMAVFHGHRDPGTWQERLR